MFARQFTAYGPSHWGVLGLFVIGAGLLVWVGRRQTERQVEGAKVGITANQGLFGHGSSVILKR